MNRLCISQKIFRDTKGHARLRQFYLRREWGWPDDKILETITIAKDDFNTTKEFSTLKSGEEIYEGCWGTFACCELINRFCKNNGYSVIGKE